MDQPHIIELAQWLDSPPGQYVLAWERARIDSMVANVFGYHAMQIGLPEIDFLGTSRIRHKGRTSVDYQHGQEYGAMLVTQPEQLPFDTQSLDLLVLPHVLECSANPHQILREAERVLMPEGRVVISGFNPWSLWGARERIPGLDPLLPIPAQQQVSLIRLKDWFKLLSLELDSGHFGAYAPPCQTAQWLGRWSFMESAGSRWWPVCGAVYAVSAVKRVQGMRLVGPAWSRRRAHAGARGAVVGRTVVGRSQKGMK